MIIKYGNVIVPGLCICLLAVVACQTSSQSARSYKSSSSSMNMVKASSAENLLDAEGGPFRMVEIEAEDISEISPLEAHMRARKNVHPEQTKAASKYTRKYGPDGEPEHVRVFQLEPVGEAAAPTQYARADISVVPKAKPDFDQGAGDLSYPVPGHKPEILRVAAKPAAVNTLAKEPQKVATPQARPRDGLSVAAVRFGEHPGKTRMVIDLTDKTAFSHHLSDENRLLDIEIAGAAWDAGLEAKILQHPLILGYRAQSDQSGTHLSLKLKRPGRVIWSAALKPDHGKGDRLVFDIAAL